MHGLRGTVANRLYRGGVGAGKTVCLAADVGLAVIDNPGCRGLVVAPTYTMLHDVVLPEIVDVFDRLSEEIGHRFGIFSKSRFVWHFPNGYELYMRSASHADRLRGLTLAHGFVDEIEACANPEYVSNILLGRLRQTHRPPKRILRYSGISYYTTPSGHSGVVGLFEERCNEQDPDFAVVIQRSDENPVLKPQFFKSMKSSYSLDFYEEQVNATVVAKAGAVYGKTFKREEWKPRSPVISGNLIDWGRPKPELPTYLGIDWGHRYPHLLWLQHDVNGAYTGQPDTGVVIAEYCPDDMPLVDLMDYIGRTMAISWWPKVTKFLIDPGGPTSLEGRRALRDRWPHIPVDMPRDPSERSLRFTIELIKGRLQRADMSRRLLFSTSNATPDNVKRGLALSQIVRTDQAGTHRGVICCMVEGYRWLRDGYGLVPEKGVYDHGPDAIRYIASVVWRHELLGIIGVIKPQAPDQAMAKRPWRQMLRGRRRMTL